MRNQLEILPRSGFSTAIVEAGQFYADTPFSRQDALGLEIGKQATGLLVEMGINVTRCVLVDDYNAEDIHSEENLMRIREVGFEPSIVYRERACTPGATQIFDQLRDSNQAKLKKKTASWHLKHSSFAKLKDNEGKFSCALLDAALYRQKQNDFGGACVTILPLVDGVRDYTKQQEYTRAILKSANISVPVLNIFYDTSGNVSVDFDF